MQYKDKTTFISPEMELKDRDFETKFITVTGAGPVYVEFLEEDNVWRSFPETTFYGPTASFVHVKKGKYRVNIAAPTATTVELR